MAARNTLRLQRYQRYLQNALYRSFASSTAVPEAHKYDVVIVGGGIVGAATARELAIRYPNLKLALVEKEYAMAVHQSSRNSGVMHAGIYYTPGSLKAKLCVRGIDLAYKYCDEHSVPYKRCGKLIVAVEPAEIPRLEALFHRGNENNVKGLELIDGSRIPEFEPHCKGLKAIWSPHTGIIDWGVVTKSFANDFQRRGGTIYFNYKVDSFKEGQSSPPELVISAKDKPNIHAKYAITCAGLQADLVAKMSGCSAVPKIIPFRGEYLLLKPEKTYLVRGNIYPVPDPALPFLGFHYTPRMNGDIWMGPNAVLAYAREGYDHLTISPRDLADSLAFKGMWKLMSKHMAYGVKEFYESFWTRAQVKKLQRFIPELKMSDVTRGPAGVRAQALSDDGSLVDDFVFDSGEGSLGKHLLHVRNAPSPACTSSLAIAEMVADRAAEDFSLRN